MDDAESNSTKSLVDDLDARDKEILKLKQTNRKLPMEAIGKILGISKQAVFQRMQKDKFKRVWEALERDVYAQIKNLHNDAILVYMKALKDPDIKIALKASSDILKYVFEQQAAMPDQEIDDVLEFIDE